MKTSRRSLGIATISMFFVLIASIPMHVSAATYNDAKCNGVGIVLDLPKNAQGDYVAKKGTTFTGRYYGINTGTTTWTRGTYFPYHPAYGISWISPDYPPVLTSSSVSPGSSAVASFSARALDVGRAEFTLQMYQKYVSDFGAICTVMVQVDSTSQVADLAILKSGPATINAGTLITYKLAVKNLGSTRADTIVVRDIIPAGLTYNEAASETPCNQVGTNVECPLSYLGAGQTRTFTLKFDVAQNACGTTIINRSSVTTVSNDMNSANNQSEARTTVSACPAR